MARLSVHAVSSISTWNSSCAPDGDVALERSTQQTTEARQLPSVGHQTSAPPVWARPLLRPACALDRGADLDSILPVPIRQLPQAHKGSADHSMKLDFVLVARFVEGPLGVAGSEHSGAGELALAYERFAGAARRPLTGKWRRREPERTVLHATVRAHL